MITGLHTFIKLYSPLHKQRKERWNFSRNIMMYLLHDVTIKMLMLACIFYSFNFVLFWLDVMLVQFLNMNGLDFVPSKKQTAISIKVNLWQTSDFNVLTKYIPFLSLVFLCHLLHISIYIGIIYIGMCSLGWASQALPVISIAYKSCNHSHSPKLHHLSGLQIYLKRLYGTFTFCVDFGGPCGQGR